MLHEKRKALCEKIAAVDDMAKPDFFDQAGQLAEALPQQTTLSWRCELDCQQEGVSRNQNRIIVNFGTGKLVLQQIRILIVEDDDVLRASLKVLIGSDPNAIITVASDGRAAINLLTHNYFDIVFLDVNLPDISGLEVLRFSKQKHPGLSVHMVSANDSEQRKLQAEELQADGFIGKPFEPETILTIINDRFMQL